MEANSRPEFEWKIEAHMYNTHPHFWLRKIRQKTRFCERMCVLGVAKPKFNIYIPFSQKPPFWGPISTVPRNFQSKNSFNIGGAKSKQPLNVIIMPYMLYSE